MADVFKSAFRRRGRAAVQRHRAARRFKLDRIQQQLAAQVSTVAGHRQTLRGATVTDRCASCWPAGPHHRTTAAAVAGYRRPDRRHSSTSTPAPTPPPTPWAAWPPAPPWLTCSTPSTPRPSGCSTPPSCALATRSTASSSSWPRRASTCQHRSHRRRHRGVALRAVMASLTTTEPGGAPPSCSAA